MPRAPHAPRACRVLRRVLEQYHQPGAYSNFWAFAYYVFGVAFFAFFLNNLFIGVVFETYMRLRAVDRSAEGSNAAEALQASLTARCFFCYVFPRRCPVGGGGGGGGQHVLMCRHDTC